MAEDRRHDAGYLLVGFVVGSLTIGLVFYLIAKSLAALRGSSQGQLGAGGQPINIYNVSGGQPSFPAQAEPSARQVTEGLSLPGGVSLASRANTVMLGPRRSARVFSAPRNGPMWRVRISVIGPAGGYGVFAIDAPLPAETNTNLTIGAPEGIVVRAGGWTEVRIGPRQIIYGKAAGTEDDVQVSILASPEIV